MDRMTSLAIFTSVRWEEGSIAAAARRHRSPAMAGRHLISLEQALKARLYSAQRGRLHVTDVGSTRLPSAVRRILEEFEEAQREARRVTDSPQGSLRIAVQKACGGQWGFPLPLICTITQKCGASMASDRFIDVDRRALI